MSGPLVLGPNPAGDRMRRVVIARSQWGDGAVWQANLTPEAGSSLANLTTRQPSQVAGFDVSGGPLILTGGQDINAQLDVVSVILANATPEATIKVGVGDTNAEADGTGTADVSGWGKDGTLGGSARFDVGQFEGGVYVEHDTADVTGDHILSPNGVNLNGDGTFGMSMRVRLLDVVSRVLFQGNGYVLETDASGHVTVRGTALASSDPLIAESWYKIGLVIGMDGGDGVLLVDDAEVSRQALTPNGDGTGTMVWGSTASTGLGMTGWLDDLRLYGSVMSVLEMATATFDESAAGPFQPVLHYKLNGYQSATVPFGMLPNRVKTGPDQRRSSFLLLPYRMTAQTVRITIADPTNPHPLRIGRLFVGMGDQPSRQNYSEGYKLTQSTDAKRTRTPSGITLVEPRPVIPGLEFTLENVPRSEALLTWLDQYQWQAGTSEPLLVCLDPDAPDSMEALFCYGTLTDLSDVTPAFYDGWRLLWRVEAMR